MLIKSYVDMSKPPLMGLSLTTLNLDQESKSWPGNKICPWAISSVQVQWVILCVDT